MHSLRRASIFWFSFVLVPSLLFGQGSGSTIGRSMGGPQGSFMVTQSIVVTLTRAAPNGKQFVVVHEKSEAPFTFAVEDTTKLKAHKEIKRRLAKKKISWADLQSGMRIRVTWVLATEEVTEVKVLRYKKKSLTGTLQAVNNHDRSFIVVDEKKEAPFTFAMEDTARLKAHKEIKRRLGKKKISWVDLQSGMRIRVTSVAATEEVLDVEVLKYEKKSLTGTLQAINNHDRSFTVVDEKSGKPRTFPIEDSAKIKADRRVKQILAKKKISWADLQSGMRIQVTSIASKVLEIKILGYGKKS